MTDKVRIIYRRGLYWRPTWRHPSGREEEAITGPYYTLHAAYHAERDLSPGEWTPAPR